MTETSIEPGRFERTQPYLRPDEVDTLEHEIQGIDAQLQGPDFIRQRIQDIRGQTQRARQLKGQLESQRPQPYHETRVDSAVKREVELRETIKQGMPTSREQRHNPAGNVDKHMGWEKRNKANIREWKNIRRRLVEGGQLDDGRDVANVESLRPAAGHAQEGNLDNCAVPRKVISMPSAGPAVTNGVSDEEYERVKAEARALQAEIDQLKAKKAPGAKDRLPSVKPWRVRARELGITTFQKTKQWTLEEIARREALAEHSLDDDPED